MTPGRLLPLVPLVAILSCSGGKPATPLPLVARPATPASSSHVRVVFVIAMENHDAAEVYGNTRDAPYINQLLTTCARADQFTDELPDLDSEPHYLWMEAGTNTFADHTFTNDDDPSASNSTASTAHLSTQIEATGGRVTWRAYQEGINSATGACPIHGSGSYAPKHDPFVFFRDVSGSPPSATNASCAEHHSPLTALAPDVAADTLATYNFITPDLCNDMHGQSGCPDSNTIRAGDTWLAQNLPPLIDYVDAHSGVVFVTWDEGNGTNTMPFLAVGPGVKPGYRGSVRYDHSSLVRSLEEILGVPVLPTVAGANDLGDLFVSGAFP